MAMETRLALRPLLHRCTTTSNPVSLSNTARQLPVYLLPSIFHLPLSRRSISSSSERSQAPPPAAGAAAAAAVESEAQQTHFTEDTSSPSRQQEGNKRREAGNSNEDDFSFLRRQASEAAVMTKEAGEMKRKPSWAPLNELLRNASNPSGRRPLIPLTSGGIGSQIDFDRMQVPESATSEGNGEAGGQSPSGDESKTNWNYSSLFPVRRSNLTPNTTATEAEMAAPVFKVSPSMGRTVEVDSTRGMDVARALRTVDIKCAQNSVKHDANRQRFHERPGLKRKRLRRERWRYRFKTAFQATVRRVEALNRQGW